MRRWPLIEDGTYFLAALDEHVSFIHGPFLTCSLFRGREGERAVIFVDSSLRVANDFDVRGEERELGAVADFADWCRL